MKTYPLHSISLEQAKQLQFKVIDAIFRERKSSRWATSAW